MPLSADTKLGPYEILGPIGEGGMGEVYKARDPRLDRTVAIKVSKAEFTERFTREARLVAQLNHANICTINLATNRIRIPDVVVAEMPIPEEEVFTTPPCLCVEVTSPDDTVAAMQDRLDDYLQFGVPNIWVIDPWKHRGWHVTAGGWATAGDGVIRTADGRIAMPLDGVLLP